MSSSSVGRSLLSSWGGAWIAALGALVGLILVLYPTPNASEHQRLTASLIGISEVNAQLDVSLLKAWNADRHNYDPISRLSAELDLLRPPPESFPAELRDQAAELSVTIDRRREAIERFKSQDAVLKNSRAWLLASTREWSRGDSGVSDTSEELIAQGIRSIVELLLYHGESFEGFSPGDIQTELAELHQRLSEIDDSEAARIYFQNLRRHVEIFSMRLPRVRALVEENVSLPVSQIAEDLLASYGAHHQRSIVGAAYGRALAVLLMLFSIYQLFRSFASANRDRLELRDEVEARQRQLEKELEERKKAEAVLRDVASAVSSPASDSFFQDLLNRITVALDLEYAFIGKLSEVAEDRIETIAVSAGGGEVDNVCYQLADAPCENVVGRALCCYPDNVDVLFPKDQMLIDMGVVSYCGAPLFDSRDRPIGLVAVMDKKPFENVELVESVTRIISARVADELERYAVEAAIRAEKERFSVMLRSIGDGVIAADLSRKVVLINKEAERLTGWTQREAQNQDLGEVFHVVDPNTGRLHGDILKRVVERKKLVVLGDTSRLLRQDGSSCLVTDSCAPIFDVEKKIIGVIVVFRDVTERRRVEEEKNKIEGQLFQLQKMETIGTLAGGIAHEFNNLLTPIVGYASVCLELIPPSEEAHKHVEMILSGSRRAQKLVSQMSKFGRQYKLDRQPVQLRETIEDVADLVRSIAPSTISVEVSAIDDLGVVRCDENQIHQVIINLCTNAYLAMEPDGGKLKIAMRLAPEGPTRRLDREREYLAIVISDTGCGIPPAIRSRIFDPFFTTRGVGQGTGLGLSVALGIVESHGGTIELESTVGEGTAITVFLPKEDLLVLRPQSSREEAAPVLGDDECILFVDDEPGIVEMAKVLLGQYGYDLVTSDDSVAALELFQEEPARFDLVITDYTMPGMSGFELGRSIRKIRPGIPLLLTTGNAHSVSEGKVRSEGFLALVQKPITGNQLRAAVRQALQR